MKITEHFNTEELTRTDTGLENKPDPTSFSNLYDLCFEVLEPVRKLLSDYSKKIIRIKINSGYRSEEVNKAVKGKRNSQHLAGQAADFVPVGIMLTSAFKLIKESNIPFDQMILYNGFIHISHSKNPRRQPIVKK